MVWKRTCNISKVCLYLLSCQHITQKYLLSTYHVLKYAVPKIKGTKERRRQRKRRQRQRIKGTTTKINTRTRCSLGVSLLCCQTAMPCSRNHNRGHPRETSHSHTHTHTHTHTKYNLRNYKCYGGCRDTTNYYSY